MTCELSTGIGNLNAGAGVMGSAFKTANDYIVPYTNPQSIVWDEDTENFMDEWTMFDIAGTCAETEEPPHTTPPPPDVAM